MAALKRSFAGPADKSGRRLYSSWLFDSGIASNDWRGWKLESAIPGFDGMPLIATLGAGSLAQIFTTPPTRSRARRKPCSSILRSFDFDRDAPKIEATTPEYPVSAMDFMAPTDWRNPKLAELKAAAGKVIVYHGASDGAFSLQATIDWYEKLRANNGGDVSDFARFYPVPGMAHCGGGPATDRLDAFGALVAWVEQGAAPGSLTASARAENPRSRRTGARRERGRYATGRRSRATATRAIWKRPRASSASRRYSAGIATPLQTHRS